MKDALACARARVDDRSVAALGKSLLIGHARGHAQQVAQDSLLALRSLVK
jgi:hypothetical protein